MNSPTDLPHDPVPGVPDESEKSLTVMGGLAGPADLADADLDLAAAGGGGGSGGSKLLSQGTLLILAVAALAAGTIYVMRLRTLDKPRSGVDSAVAAKIEQYLTRTSKPEAMAPGDPLHPKNIDALFRDAKAVAALLSDDPATRQVPIQFVKKNPFVLAVPAPVVAAVAVAAQPGVAQPVADRAAEAARLKLEREFASLKLQSIVGGPRPVAIINDDLVQVGTTLGSFTVQAITGLSVELVAGGKAFRLTLEAKPDAKDKPTLRR